MKRHLENETLASLATGLLGEDEKARSLAHLKECGPCSERYRLYEALMQEIPVPDEVHPPERVRRRIFTSYREIREREEARGRSRIRSLFPSLRAVYVLAASSAIALFAALWFFTGTDSGGGRPAVLGLSAMSGAVTMNGKPAGEGVPFTTGSRIDTGSGASLHLTYGKILTVRVAGETTLSMENSLERPDAEGSLLEFRIERGTVVSISEYRSGVLSLTYITPFGKISPIGTEFLVRSDAASTTVMVAKGSVSVRCTATGETRTGLPGEKIIVAAAISSSAMDDRDMELFRIMKGEERPGTMGPVPGSGKKPDDTRTPAADKKGKPSPETTGGGTGDGTPEEKQERERDQRREMRRESREGMQDKRDVREMREMRQNSRGRGQ